MRAGLAGGGGGGSRSKSFIAPFNVSVFIVWKQIVVKRVVHVKLLALDPRQRLLQPAPSVAESSDDPGITAQRIRSARIEYKSYI
jgi:hypothetical protein